MGVHYAVSWRAPDEPPRCGRLEVRPDRVVFVGSGAERTVGFDELASVRISRSANDRVGGQPALVLERRDAAPIRVASLDAAGVVLELAERLAAAVRA